MKKKIAMAALTLSAVLLAGGCKSKEVDVDKYVTLGEYMGIEYTPASTEVTEEDLQAAIDKALEENPETIKVMDKNVADGDTVNIDYRGVLEGETEPFEGGTASDQELVIGSGKFIEGFEDGLIGVKPGDSVDLNLKFSDNYQEEGSASAYLNGKAVDFRVTVNYIDGGDEDAVYNDEFVQRISDFETIKTYEADMMKQLQETKNKEAEDQKLNDIFTKVVENCEISEVPDSEYQKYYDSLIAAQENYATQFGMDLESFITNLYGMDMESFEAQISESATSLAKQAMVYRAIANKEGLTVSDEEFDTAAEEQFSQYEANFASVEEFKKQAGEDFREALLYDKVYDLVLNAAVATDAKAE